MKNYLLNYVLLSLLLMSLLMFSCKKPPIPKDPCKNTHLVTATTSSEFQLGHFLDANGKYLNAVNYYDYASRIQEGKQYQLGYRVTQCFTRCGTIKGQDGIREGGCVIQPECIEITCLKEVPNQCNRTQVDYPGFDDLFSQHFEDVSIQGNTLNAKIFFSGCSENDIANMMLLLQEEQVTVGAMPVLTAKFTDIRNGYICQAYFERKACFDLSPIKNYYYLKSTPSPESVIIRLVRDSETKDLVYTLR